MAKILIIDDEEPILKMYKEALSKHQVLTAKNGQEGLEIAEKESPDLILLDIIMPEINGLDVLDRMKENSDISAIPVVVLTNLPEEASKEKANQLGATDYLVKAENEPDVLAEKVDKLVGEK